MGIKQELDNEECLLTFLSPRNCVSETAQPSTQSMAKSTRLKGRVLVVVFRGVVS